MKILKEPLIHFLGIGALLFIVYFLVNGDAAVLDSRQVKVTSANIEHLRSLWVKQWNRAPSQDELKKLVEDHIREEVLYREALNLGLDRDDTIIRRRLTQKMEFISEDLADQWEPSTEELNRFFENNKENYRVPARLTFSHIYFNPDAREDRVFADAESTLAKIRARPTSAIKPFKLGDRFMLQSEYAHKDRRDIAALFGSKFAETLLQTQTGSWQGPIESGYGFHLVHVTELIPSRLPQLAEVEDRLQIDWQFKQRRKFNQAIYQQFRARYEIEVADIPSKHEIAQATAKQENPL